MYSLNNEYFKFYFKSKFCCTMTNNPNNHYLCNMYYLLYILNLIIIIKYPRWFFFKNNCVLCKRDCRERLIISATCFKNREKYIQNKFPRLFLPTLSPGSQCSLLILHTFKYFCDESRRESTMWTPGINFESRCIFSMSKTRQDKLFRVFHSIAISCLRIRNSRRFPHQDICIREKRGYRR